MNSLTESRELFNLGSADDPVWGTYHKPDGLGGDAPSSNSKLLGVVFLNSLSPTRAATGDSAVFWAEAFAAHGYPAFRLDLPGFGDSAGDPPPDLLAFINKGGCGQIAAPFIDELVQRYALSGVILFGLCAGAVTTVYAAAASRKCRGMVLLDPYFHLPFTTRTDFWFRAWQKLTGRFSRTSLGIGLADLWSKLKAVPARLLLNGVPRNANFALLNHWKELNTAGMPILLFKAPSIKIKGEFDYLDHILALAGRKGRVTVKIIQGAGHTFSNQTGRTAVREETQSWLNSTFPQEERQEVLTTTESMFLEQKPAESCVQH